MRPYLNLGCGGRFHPDWINMDMAPSDPRVISCDLSKGIPLPDDHCSVVYHAAVLEHFRRADALTFLRECERVLVPGGCIRVGVPDLEQLVRLYSERLQRAVDGEPAAANDYDWLMLELFDQLVRERSGGDMAAWLGQEPLPNEAFVYQRIGEEGRALVRALRNQRTPASRQAPRSLRGWLRARRRQFGRLPATAKRMLLTVMLSSTDRRALAIGRFRLGGEAHQWMYDRFSLARLLLSAGFRNPVLQDAKTSQVQDWLRFELDALADGTVIKPDLLFMEAVK